MLTMDRPLDGIRVLDLGQIYNGPYAGLILGYLGAEVIKIEPPGGEIIRSRAGNSMPPNLMMLNSNKKGVEIDLKKEAGRDLFLNLVAASDVVLENFRKGVMERFDLGYEELRKTNSEIIYAHGSGFGDSGPYSDFPAMDLTIQSISGAANTTGFPDGPPTVAGPAFADFLAGIHLATGIVSALYQRERTGEGEYVDVSMMDCIYPTLASPLSAWVRDTGVPQRTGNRQSGLSTAPYNIYEIEDGYVAIICVTNRHWEQFLRLADREDLIDDDRFSTKIKRAENMEEVDQLVQGWLTGRTRDEAIELLRDNNIPTAPVQDLDDVVEDPQLHHRDMIHRVSNPGPGKDEIPIPGMPIKFAGSDEPEIRPAPKLGKDTDTVLKAIADYSDTQIEKLREQEVV